MIPGHPKRALLVLFSALAFLSAAPRAGAAQDAMVTVEQAAIRERPLLDAKIIESVPAATNIRVSSFNKDGWYKTKTSLGQFGWVWQGDISLSAHKDDVKAAGLELQERGHERRSQTHQPWLYLRAGGTLAPLISPEVAKKVGLGAGHLFFTYGGLAEVAVRVDETMRVALRIQDMTNSATVNYFNNTYNISESSLPVMLGFDADLTSTDVFETAVGFYGGMSLSNKLTVEAPNAVGTAASSFTIDKMAPVLLINFSAKYHFQRWFTLVGEVGFFYTHIPKGQIPNLINGGGPFQDDANTPSVIHVNMTGPQFAVAAQINL